MTKILDFVFKKFPAYFWEKPHIYKIILFPVLFIFYLKENNDKKSS